MDGQQRAVIFDMDGVLVDTAQAHFQSWQVIAEQYGVEITWEAFHRTFGRPNHQIIPELLGRSVAPGELRRIDDRKEEAFREILSQSIEPLPGTVELIHGLSEAGFRIGLGSSGPPENIRAILQALEVEPFFKAVVSGHDVERGKPAPDVFLMVAERLAVEPHACLVIEDVPAGVEAAHRAGMKCLAVTTTHQAASLEEADVIRDDLRGVGPSDVAALLDEDGAVR